MNIHKFNVRPKKTIPPKTIHWQPLREVKYPALKVNSITWETFSQENIKLEPKEAKEIQLGLGFIMTNNSNHIVDIQNHKLLCRVCYKEI